MVLSLAVLTQYQRVTDENTHTNIQTHNDGIYRASIESSGKYSILSLLIVIKNCYFYYDARILSDKCSMLWVVERGTLSVR